LFNSIIGVLGRVVNRFPADYDATFSQQIFNISMAETESVVEPDRVTDDVGWEPVPFVSIHPPILSIQ
jgi:hypothetical protein